MRFVSVNGSADASEIAEVPPDHERLAHDVALGDKTPIAAVAAAVAVVSHQKVIALRHAANEALAAVIVVAIFAMGERAHGGYLHGHGVGIDEDRMRMRVELFFELTCGRKIEAALGVLIVALRCEWNFVPIYGELLVHIGDRITGHANDTLDVIERGILRIAEHHHLAALGRVHVENLDVDNGQAHTVREFVDENKVAHQQRGDHGARRNLERLDQERAQQEHHEDHGEEALGILHPPRLFGHTPADLLELGILARLILRGTLAGHRLQLHAGLLELASDDAFARTPQEDQIEQPYAAGHHQQHQHRQGKVHVELSLLCEAHSGNRHALFALYLQNREERLLRDFHRPDLLHAALARLLFFQQLFLARDVAAIALGEHILAQGFDVFTRDDVRPDRCLHRHVEHLSRDELAHLLGELAPARLRARAMHDERQRIDPFAVDENIELHQIGHAKLLELVVERSIAATYRFQLIEEIHHYFVERELPSQQHLPPHVLHVLLHTALGGAQRHHRADIVARHQNR